jgi:hypothetical protein
MILHLLRNGLNSHRVEVEIFNFLIPKGSFLREPHESSKPIIVSSPNPSSVYETQDIIGLGEVFGTIASLVMCTNLVMGLLRL